MKIYLILILLWCLTGCSPSSSNDTSSYQMPPEMEGCKVFTLTGDGFHKTLYVVKCPGGTTTTNWQEKSGKNSSRTYSVTTQDGQ